MAICIGGDSCACGGIYNGSLICNTPEDRNTWTGKMTGGPCGGMDFKVTRDPKTGNYTVNYGCGGDKPVNSFSFDDDDYISKSPLYAVSKPQPVSNNCGYPGGLIRFCLNGTQQDCDCYGQTCGCRDYRTPIEIELTLPPFTANHEFLGQKDCIIYWDPQPSVFGHCGGLCKGGCSWGGTYILEPHDYLACTWVCSMPGSLIPYCFCLGCQDCVPAWKPYMGSIWLFLSPGPSIIMPDGTRRFSAHASIQLRDIGGGAVWQGDIVSDSPKLPTDCCNLDADVPFDAFSTSIFDACWGGDVGTNPASPYWPCNVVGANSNAHLKTISCVPPK